MGCVICENDEAEWIHGLDASKVTFRLHGKAYIWADRVRFCDRCQWLYAAGDDETLVRLKAECDGIPDHRVDEEIRRPFGVLRSADLGVSTMNESLPPGAAELRAAGFTPLEELTGAVRIALAWPEEHRRSVPETRELWLDDTVEGRFWLVRSPWPALSARDVVSLLWRWVERDRLPHDDDRDRAETEEFFGWDEQRVLEFLRRGERH